MGHILESDFILVPEQETMVLKSSGAQSLWLRVVDGREVWLGDMHVVRRLF